MKIERFFYTRDQKKMNERIKMMQEAIEEAPEVLHMNEVTAENILDGLPEFPEVEVYRMADVNKYKRFCELGKMSVDLARKICANLLVEEDEWSGCIIFVGEQFNFDKNTSDNKILSEVKSMFAELAMEADEMTVRPTVDTGAHSPTDFNELVQLEFWFDFYKEQTQEI